MLVVIFTATTFPNCHGRVLAVPTAAPWRVLWLLFVQSWRRHGVGREWMSVISETKLPMFGQVLRGDMIRDGAFGAWRPDSA